MTPVLFWTRLYGLLGSGVFRVLGSALLLILASALTPALAHKPSDAYLRLALDPAGQITGRWDIALRDLEFAVGLDDDGDGAITWGELSGARAAVEAYALSRLGLSSGGRPCPLSSRALQVDRHTDGSYAVLDLQGRCPAGSGALELRYSLLFELDPLHRGLLSLSGPTGVQTRVLSPEQPSVRLEQGRASTLETVRPYLREGVWHIWHGIDHLLFLLTLLLPSVLRREGGRWVAVGTLPGALSSVLKVVTAFTLAHSLTLTLAATGVLKLPSSVVESVIAASVVLAALNNVFPVVQEDRRWWMALGFGLIHGFGFASVLAGLGLPAPTLALSLLAFNVGVELGQLAVVLLFVPLAFVLRRTPVYHRLTFTGGSLMVAAIATVWLGERLLNFKVLPW